MQSINLERNRQNEESFSSQGSLVTTDRLIAFWEIASVTVSFLIAEWIVRPLGGSGNLIAALPLAMALSLMIISHKARRETWSDIGWRLNNFWDAMRLLTVPMLGATTLILIVGFYSGGFSSHKWLEWRWLLWLLLWGFIQQYALQGFINRRAQLVFGRGFKSVLVVATIFAILHLPNPFLALATFLGGLIWAVVYQRTPNLFALSVSHALMSVLLIFALPNSVLRSLRVGFKYFA